MRIDTRCFDTHDVADIALQRTTTLAKWPLLGAVSYRAWARNISIVLHAEAALRRSAILRIALTETEAEYRAIKAALGVRSVRRMMDIGRGHGLIDVFFYADFRSHIHLVDIESNAARRHDFAATGAGYGSLAKARRYLQSNGVPDDCIVTTNPTDDAVQDHELDLIISLLSCGFHYPVSEYAEFARRALKPGECLFSTCAKTVGRTTSLPCSRVMRCWKSARSRGVSRR